MVQGAATGYACLECWAVFNQGIQAPEFLFSSSFLPWPREGHTGIDMQVGNRAWLWLIEKAEREWLIFPSTVRYPSFKRKKNDQEKETSLPDCVRSCIAWLKCFIYLWISIFFWLLINNVVLFIHVGLVDFFFIKIVTTGNTRKAHHNSPYLVEVYYYYYYYFTFFYIFCCVWLSEIHGSLGGLRQAE